MKKNIILLVALMMTIGATAQKNVKLRINHKMNGSAFALNSETTNSLGNKFNFSRAQYYLSNIKIIHDGGQETKATDVYLLVDAAKSVDFDLGSYNVTTIEKIIFSVGVDNAKNHLNPTIYDPSHALAPKSPSMHWGWSAGYRFVAIEGKSGDDLKKTWEFHSLLDKYYYTIYLPATATAVGQSLVITINADYAKAISSIDVSGGIVAHGLEEEELIVLDNFRDSVFSNLDGLLDVEDLVNENFVSFPNPSIDGKVYLNDAILNKVRLVQVTNVLGEKIQEIVIDEQTKYIELTENGVYFFSYFTKQGKVHQQKIMVIK